jgi:hypothetical protein
MTNRIIHVGRNEVAEISAGTAQLSREEWDTLFVNQRSHGDRSSGSVLSCLFRPTSP